MPLSDEQPKLTPWVLCPLFISYMLSRVDFTIFFLLQPLAQSLEDLDLVSQQVSTSVSEVTLAKDEKAEVLLTFGHLTFPLFVTILGSEHFTSFPELA